MDNTEEMDKFLEKHNLPRLNQDEIEKMNLKVMLNTRNTKRINTKMLKKDVKIIECGEGK